MHTPKERIREKGLRRIAARIEEIHRELRLRPLTPLPKKIFVGHWRYLAVRRDVLRSSIGSQVQMVVDRCNYWVLGRLGTPSSYRPSTEVAVSSLESRFTQDHGLRPLGRAEWLDASFPDFFEKKWFRKVNRVIRAGTKNIEVPRYFPQVPAHMLEFAYKKAYITESQVPDGTLESELKRLYASMRTSHGWEKISGRNVDEWDMNLRRRKLREMEADDEVRKWSNLPSDESTSQSPNLDSPVAVGWR